MCVTQMYKRHDPGTVEEIEFMENLFNSLCSALMLPANRDRFLKGEGIQLMNLMLRLACDYVVNFIFSYSLTVLFTGQPCWLTCRNSVEQLQ